MCGRQSVHAITGAWQQTDDIRQHMLYFLENHDEQRIASDFFAGDARKGVPALVVSALFGQNPLMIYFGQEYGERGMDKEGFSGLDGRTTIFDYWSVDTIVRAACRKSTKDEKVLCETYKKVLAIAQGEKAVTQGVSFDLMYVNGATQRQYAFLRKTGKEVLLVVVNFDDAPAFMDVRIPAHAFDYLTIKEKSVTAKELLTGENQELNLKRDGTIAIKLETLGAKVLKFIV
jgi:glycosidase